MHWNCQSYHHRVIFLSLKNFLRSHQADPSCLWAWIATIKISWMETFRWADLIETLKWIRGRTVVVQERGTTELGDSYWESYWGRRQVSKVYVSKNIVDLSFLISLLSLYTWELHYLAFGIFGRFPSLSPPRESTPAHCFITHLPGGGHCQR